MESSGLLNVALVGLGVALAHMTLAWAVSVVLRRTDVADVAWGLGFVVLGWWGALVEAPQPAGTRVWLVSALVTLWGVRLAWHIGARNFAPGREEDERYARMRERATGSWAARSLVTVFWLQAVLMWLVALPLAVLAAAPQPGPGWLDLAAIAVWGSGFAFEAIGDRQLRRWLASPANRGRPLERGVWAWSRHPNYFGDALQWWGIGLLALRMPFGVVALVGPLAMTLLLRFVSGVPLLEARHTGEPAWDSYRSRTSVFLPRPPRSG